MHMSDGIVNAPTSLLFGVIAIAALGFCGWRTRNELDERTVPLAGLVAAFIFAVQMVNFPILPGVSGHLLGGALAAILVGPYTGALCIAIVLIVHSLLIALGVVAFLAAVIGTICASMGFVIEYAIGGAASAALGTVVAYMLGTHALTGVGEGIITALTVTAVARARPDLVYLLRSDRTKVPA